MAKPFLSKFFIIVISIYSSINLAQANNCLNFMPAKTVAIHGLKICKSAFNGILDNYGCQEYQSEHQLFRVLYKGGALPKAIIAVDEQKHEELIWSMIFAGKKIDCPIVAPRGIHLHAKHLGTGICHDELNHDVACSVYEHKASLRIELHRYLVLYPNEKSKTQKVRVTSFVYDASVDAMTAEIAYQFGLSLLDSNCCSQQAMAYLEYAYHLYPKANKYSKAYNNARFNFSSLNFNDTLL